MEKFLIFPIHQPEYATHGSGNGLYDPFVVDIWGNSGEFQRGYVCDVDEHGLSVKLDGHTVQRVPFGRAWLVKQQDFQESAIHLNSGDVDVRISPTDMGVASWTPARLVNSISCASTEMYKCSSCPYSVATVEVIQPGTMATRYTVIDGPTALAQRLRKRRDLGPLVPQKAFQKVHMRMFDASAEYPYPERLMRTARSSPRFQNFWLRLTRTMLVSLHDGYTEVLLPPDFEKYCSREDDDNEGDDHCRPVWKSIGDFVDRLLVMQHRTVDRILDGLVIALLQSHEIHDNELCFDELFFEIQLFVYSYLDIFDQNLVKRHSGGADNTDLDGVKLSVLRIREYIANLERCFSLVLLLHCVASCLTILGWVQCIRMPDGNGLVSMLVVLIQSTLATWNAVSILIPVGFIILLQDELDKMIDTFLLPLESPYPADYSDRQILMTESFKQSLNAMRLIPVRLTAGRFFIIDRGFIAGLVGFFATYAVLVKELLKNTSTYGAYNVSVVSESSQ
ncbi:uncharacterized protein LOC129591052 isoform X3 [Paramacrobiotus metropolitanus]|uniref:uncharacterized protein LOC129591052 isoform X3 n=1 Tax=Paramacrobiotus metropolitanus TaxID=2943436 RepID=UPI002445AA50|nr:uncharacterized protein LOC129591052 isoform X3 [Paramacrobiotus metropolitanus]